MTHQQALSTVMGDQPLVVASVRPFRQELFVVLTGVDQVHQRFHITAVKRATVHDL